MLKFQKNKYNKYIKFPLTRNQRSNIKCGTNVEVISRSFLLRKQFIADSKKVTL